MINNDADIPKYRKKKPSSISKSKEKAKHKHNYQECLLVEKKEKDHPYRATYCTICGKIGDIHFFETIPCDDGICSRLQNNNEMLERYKNLKRIEIDNIFQRYVDIEAEKQSVR